MKWKVLQKGYRSWLLLERGLSKDTIKAYTSDIQYLSDYFQNINNKAPEDITRDHLELFLASLSDFNLSIATQARMISALRSFFGYLVIENHIQENPAKLIDMPSKGRHLPDVLSVEDVKLIIASIDLSTTNGERDKAILETLYGCGLRVSELTNLKISDIFFDQEFIRVIGKGDKERLVPIGRNASEQIKRYIFQVRTHQKIAPGYGDIVFLNRMGKRLSRISIFNIVKKHTELSGVKKSVSPHSFRHSFASHLIEGGADLRSVQQMLGHASITTTEIYTHVSNRYLRDAIMQYHPMENKKI